MRFIPPKAPGVSPMRSTGVHFVDTAPGQTASFSCPQKEVGQRCPVCEIGEQLHKSSNPVDRERANRIAVKLNVMCNVVDRRAPPDDPNHGLRVLRFGKMVLEQLKTLRRNTRSGGDFFQPGPQGFDVVIMKEGEMLKTRYVVSADRNASPLASTPELAQALIDNQYDLEQFVTPVVPEEVLRAIEQLGPARQAYTGGVAWGASAVPAGGLPLPRGGQAWGVGAAPTQLAERAGAGLFGGASPGRTAADDADFTKEQPAAEDDDFGPVR